MQDYEKLLLSGTIQTVPVALPILRRAADLRALVPALRTPDAIHAATALTAGCGGFVTNDGGFRQIPGLPFRSLTQIV